MNAMIGDISPRDMLKEYRRASPDDIREHAVMFKAMLPGEQRELLFYMLVHLVRALAEREPQTTQ